jgi:hypothetical protein
MATLDACVQAIYELQVRARVPGAAAGAERASDRANTHNEASEHGRWILSSSH